MLKKNSKLLAQSSRLLNILYEKEKQYLQELLDEKIENFSSNQKLWLNLIKADFEKDPHAGIKYTKLAIDDDPQARGLRWQHGMYYSWICQYEKAIPPLEKALEIDKQWGGGWKWPNAYTLSGRVYHEVGDHKREKEIYELGLSVLPDHQRIIYQTLLVEYSFYCSVGVAQAPTFV